MRRPCRRLGHDRDRHHLVDDWVRILSRALHLGHRLGGSLRRRRLDVLLHLHRCERHLGRPDVNRVLLAADRHLRLGAVNLGGEPPGAEFRSPTVDEYSCPARSRRGCCLGGERLDAAFPALTQTGCFPGEERQGEGCLCHLLRQAYPLG